MGKWTTGEKVNYYEAWERLGMLSGDTALQDLTKKVGRSQRTINDWKSGARPNQQLMDVIFHLYCRKISKDQWTQIVKCFGYEVGRWSYPEGVLQLTDGWNVYEKDRSIRIPLLRDDWKEGSSYITLLPGGNTNRNYRVDAQDGTYVVKLPNQFKTEIVDFKNEAANILELVSSKASCVLPKYRCYIYERRNVIASDEKTYNLPNGVMVMDFISGEELNGEMLKKTAVQEALIDSLHAFHTADMRLRPMNYDPVSDEAVKYRKLALAKPALHEVLNEDEVAMLQKIESKLTSTKWSGVAAPTHNDVLTSNLIYGRDGVVYILDHEYCGTNREGFLYDYGTLLANLFGQKPITTTMFEEIIQRAEFVYGESFDRNCLYRYALINLIIMIWWGCWRSSAAETDDDRIKMVRYTRERISALNVVEAYGMLAPLLNKLAS